MACCFEMIVGMKEELHYAPLLQSWVILIALASLQEGCVLEANTIFILETVSGEFEQN